MPWNWELPHWPHFFYDAHLLVSKEREFLLKAGEAVASLHYVDPNDYDNFLVELLTNEGETSSKIEGEILERSSLQSSIKKHLGLGVEAKKGGMKEEGMAELLCSLYQKFKDPLSHEMLGDWHKKLFKKSHSIDEIGRYRTHPEPMQIVSGRYSNIRVFFEAPPSAQMHQEMEQYVSWFNSPYEDGLLARTSLAHLYFESIHPFEDGNGRIGRALVEKCLSQGVGRPILLAVSRILEKRKKDYYAELQNCNRSLDATEWVVFFSDCILQAQEESLQLLHFLIAKSKMMKSMEGNLNARQEKALLRLFQEGPVGFKGGLSAENYVSITKASRATATRDLADLVEKGALRKTGELRHTRYFLNI